MKQKIMQRPNGPKTPKLLNTLQAIIRPLESLEANARNYGDIFASKFIGFQNVVVVSNPQAIEKIFTADSKQFDSGKGNKMLLPLLG